MGIIEAGIIAKEKILAVPREHLGPAARTLREQYDREEMQALLDEVREGVYG